MLNNDLQDDESPVEIVDSNEVIIVDPTKYNEVIYFKCQEGFKLEGPEMAICQNDGLFHLEDELPKCKGIFTKNFYVLKYSKLLKKFERLIYYLISIYILQVSTFDT